MMGRLTNGVYWLTHLILIAVVLYFLRSYPASLVHGLLWGTLLTILGSGVALFSWERKLSSDLASILNAAELILLGLALTAGTIHVLPVIVEVRTIYLTHLGIFYRGIYYAFTAYATLWALRKHHHFAKAELGVVAILVYSVLNGRFYFVSGEGANLLFGLSLVTALWYQKERRRAPKRMGHCPLRLPVLMFLFGGLCATVAARYLHSSLATWLRLCNWALVYFLIVGIVRRKVQIQRLIAISLIMAVVVSIAGLWSLIGYAQRTDWHTALHARIWIGRMQSNGAGIFTAAFFMLSIGMLAAWTSRRARLLLFGGMVPLLGCTVLTYSRAAQIGLFSGLAAYALLIRRWGILHMRKKLQAKLLLLPLLPLLFLVLIGQTRTAEDSLASRLYIWRVPINVMKHRPLLGVGLNNHLIPEFIDVLQDREFGVNRRLVGLHTHNLLLEIGEGMGILGLGLFLWLSISAARYIGQSVRRSVTLSIRFHMLALSAAGVAMLIPHLISLSLSAPSLLPASLLIFLGLAVAASKLEFGGAVGGQSDAAAMTGKPGGWLDGLWGFVILLGVLMVVARPLVAATVLRHAEERGGEDRAATLSSLRLAVRLEPFDAKGLGQMANRLPEHEAEAVYRRVVSLMPHGAMFHNRLGWLHWSRNRFDLALVEFEKAASLDAYGLRGGKCQADLGLAYAAAGRRERALATFRKAVLLDPASIKKPDWQLLEKDLVLDPAYTCFATTHRVDGELALCIKHHLRRSTAGPRVFSGKGEPRIRMNDVTDKLWIEAEQTVHKKRARAMLFSLSELYLGWGMYEQLERTLMALEELTWAGTEARARVHLQRGLAYHRQRRAEEAKAEFLAGLLDENHPRLYYELGMICIQQDQMEKGIAQLERAADSWDPSVVFRPVWASYWSELARAYQRAGRLDESLRALDMTQFLGLTIPSYLDRLVALGEAYHRKAQFSRETEIYIKTLGMMAVWEQLGPHEMRVLQTMASRAVIAYQRQGFTTSEAQAAHEALIEASGDVTRAYMGFFREELEWGIEHRTFDIEHRRR